MAFQKIPENNTYNFTTNINRIEENQTSAQYKMTPNGQIDFFHNSMQQQNF